MTGDDFTAWMRHMGWNALKTAGELGIGRNTVAKYMKDGAPGYIALACTALAAALPEWTTNPKAAKLVFAMNLSLDGYVDHEAMAPGPALFRHWIEHVRGLAGSVYGRRMYEVMRYWDEDDLTWDAERREFADAWRALPKWVVSRTLKSVGPHATLIEHDLEGAVSDLKARLPGEITVSGPELAHSLTGLIDEYRLYLHPVVIGRGKPFFAGPRPQLRLTTTDRIDEDVIRLTYVPA